MLLRCGTKPLKHLFLLCRSQTLTNPSLPLCLFSSSSSSEPSGERSAPWTDEILYLDESGSVLGSAPGVRPVDPSVDSHLLVGHLRKPLSSSAAVSKLVELCLRWRWGPDLDSHLDLLPFSPSSSLLARALPLIHNSDSSLALFRWARRHPSFRLSDELLSLLFDRLISVSDFPSIQSLFDDALKTLDSDPHPFSSSLNCAIQHLATASNIEIAYCCFKKLKDNPRYADQVTAKTYNSLITLFLSKALPYKAFEIYESMEASGCSLDSSTYDLMIPSLAKSGRLDAALRLFNDLKSRRSAGSRPGFPIYAALVDSMGKAGRLDAAMGLYQEMQLAGFKPSVTMYVSMIDSMVKAGKLDAGMSLWDEMKLAKFRPNFGLYTLMVETQAKSGRLEAACLIFSDMEKAGYLPTPSTYACLIELHSSAGNVDNAMKLYNSMTNAGLKPGLTTYTCLLSVLANKKLIDLAAKVLLEMKSLGFTVDVNASDVLMIYIKDGSTEMALKWLRFMGSAGIRTNNFIVRQLFESCMKVGLYDSARPLLEMYVGSAAKVDLVLYTSILAHSVRCQDEKNEKAIMDIMTVTRHKAHEFMCGLFTGPEQRKKPVLSFVREFFQGIDYETEESAARYFVNVLLNYLVLMGQMNRARCVWKVAYENKLFPKAIVFDQHIAWSLDVRNLSVGAALVAVVHTLHRFRKRMLYYGAVPRRIKLVTGSTLKMVIAQVLASVESPFEVSKVVLRAPGDSVLEWFKKPIVQQFLLNDIPSRADVLMHKLNVLFPSSAPDVRSLSPVKPLAMSRMM